METKIADILLVSRVRTRRNNGLKHGKNSKNKTRRATSAIRRIFAEMNDTWNFCALLKSYLVWEGTFLFSDGDV